MKRGSLLIAALILLLCWSMAILVFTEFGSRRLVWLVERVSPLQIEFAGGSLASGLQLESISLVSEGLEFQLRDIRAVLDHECLWRSAVCLEQLAAETLTLEVLAGVGDEDTEEAPGPAKFIHFPIAVESDALQISSAAIRWPGGGWQQGMLTAKVRLGADGIQLADARVENARLLVEKSVEESAEESRPSTSSLPLIDLPLNLRVDNLRLPQAVFELAGEQLALETVELTGRWRNREVRVKKLNVTSQDRGALQLNGKIRLESDWPLSVLAAINSDIAFPGRELLQGQASVQLSGTVRALEFSATSEGRMILSVNGLLAPLSDDLSFEATAAVRWNEELLLGELADVPESLSAVVLHSPLQLVASGSLQEQLLKGQGSASGLGYQQMALNLEARQREGRLQIVDLSLLDVSGDNHLSGVGELDLKDVIAGRLTLSSQGIDLPDMSGNVVGRLRGGLTLGGKAGADHWRFSMEAVDVSGEVNGLPARVEGYGGLGSDLRFAKSDLRGDVNGTRFQLRTDPQAGQVPGLLQLQMDDLGRWIGGGRGTARLEAALTDLNSEIQIRGSLLDISLGSVAVEKGEFSGSLTPDARGDFRLDAQFRGVELQGEQIDSLVMSGRGDRADQELILAALGDYQGRMSLAGAWEEDQWIGSLSATAIDSPWGSWGLEKPVPVRWFPDKEVLVAAHCWSKERTRVCPGELRLGERSSGSLAVDGDMDFLAGLFPDQVNIAGSLAMNASFAWGGGEPLYLEGKSSSDNVRITRHFGAGEQATVAWDRAVAEIQQVEEGLQVSARVVNGGQPKISLDLLLPDDSQSGELQGALEFDHLQLGPLSPLVPRLSKLEGDLNGQLRFSGSPKSLRSVGRVDLTDGRVALLGNPTELEQLELGIELRDDRALISGGGLLGGGPIELNGGANLVPDLRLELQVSGERHQILFPPSTDVLLSEEMQLVVTDGLLDVRGEAVVHEGMLRHEELPEGSVTVSNNVVVVDYAGNVVREERPFDTRLDIWVRIRDSFQVEGGSLRTAVGGDLHILQEPAQPMQLFGNLNVVGGELSAYRQRLRIKRGTISFAGPPENPEFNMRAEREIRGDNVTVGVELLGSLEAPKMTVYSDPVMEQTEAMSYLIRGRGLDAGAAVDGAALALSMGADVVNQSGVLTGLERVPLISQVQLGAEGSADDTAATVSGYIGDRIYVAYGIGIYEPITVLTARLYFSARLWLEVVSRLENSVDLYYSFDIR